MPGRWDSSRALDGFMGDVEASKIVWSAGPKALKSESLQP